MLAKKRRIRNVLQQDISHHSYIKYEEIYEKLK